MAFCTRPRCAGTGADTNSTGRRLSVAAMRPFVESNLCRVWRLAPELDYPSPFAGIQPIFHAAATAHLPPLKD